MAPRIVGADEAGIGLAEEFHDEPREAVAGEEHAKRQTGALQPAAAHEDEKDQAEHDAFRDSVRAFYEKNVYPRYEQWEADGQIDREVWRAAGEAGLLGIDVPEELGGGGMRDFRFNAVIGEVISVMKRES